MFRRAAAATILCLTVPAVALAATPKAGNYGAKQGTRLVISNLTIKGGKASRFVAFTSCSPVPVPTPPKPVAVVNGAFAIHATVTDVTKQKLKIDVTGKALSATTIKLTVRYQNAAKKCDTGTKTYTAKLGLGNGQAF